MAETSPGCLVRLIKDLAYQGPYETNSFGHFSYALTVMVACKALFLIQNLDQYILFNDTSGLLNMPF
jgi:hypothetical protein